MIKWPSHYPIESYLGNLRVCQLLTSLADRSDLIRSVSFRFVSIRFDPVWLLGGNWSITESTSPCVAVLWTSFSRPATDNLHKYEAKFRRELKCPKMWLQLQLHLSLATELGCHISISISEALISSSTLAGMKNGRNAFSVNFMLSFDL